MDLELLKRKFFDYSLYMRGYSKETIKRYDRFITLFKKFADLKIVEDINERNVREFFFNGRVNRRWCTDTFICGHMTLKVFFRWCVQNGYMLRNYTEEIELPKAEKRVPPKLTKQDALRLLEAAYNYPYQHKILAARNHAILATFMFAGLRRGELLKLKFSDVDTENLTIFVRQGKGNKDRIIPMSFTLAHSLNRYISERKRMGRTCPEFFVSSTRNMGFTLDGMKHLILDMRKASGIKFNYHKLRHTFATLMLEGGSDIFSISKMMGHSDIKTTTIYLAASAEHLRSQITKHPLNDVVRI